MVKLRRKSVAVGLGLCALCAAGPRVAQAHPEQSPTLVNRYITVAPSGAQLGLHVELLFGTVPAAEMRRSMDADHDGKISFGELGAEVRAWTSRAAEVVRLTVDGHAINVDLLARIDLDGDNTTSSTPLLVEYQGQGEITAGEHRLEVAAGADLPRMGETEIVIDPANPWILRTTFDERGQAGGPIKLVRHPAPRTRPDERRAATFVVYPGGPASADDDHANPVLPIAMVIFSLLLGIGLVVLVRRLERVRRASTQPRPPQPEK